MAIPPITLGSSNWGTPVNDRFTNLDVRATAQDGVVGPGDQNIDAWAFDPGTNLTTSVLPTATISWIKIPIRASSFTTITISNIAIGVATAGSGLTVGQNFAGIYDATGTLLGTTADQTAAWQVAQFLDMPLVAPVNITTNTYVYVALLCRGTTGPTLIRGSNLAIGAGLLNWNTTATDARYANLATAATTLPASVALGTRTTGAIAWWTGVR